MDFKVLPQIVHDVKSFEELEVKIESLENTKQIGDAFEEFIYFYLKFLEIYYDVKEVYHSSEIPTEIREKLKITKSDAGIDGVWLTSDGKLCAYQVKYRSQRNSPSYEELGKFWAEARLADFTYVFANTYRVTELSEKRENNRNILVDAFENLEASFFESLRKYIKDSKIVREKKNPWPHQEKIIQEVLDGLKHNKKGKVISACGTGKTITSLWIKEALGSKHTLFLVPSLALVKQTLTEWSEQSQKSFNYLCVCSDKTVIANLDTSLEDDVLFEDENGDLKVEEIDFSVTTDVSEIRSFLLKPYETSVVFCTYQSTEVLLEALNRAEYFDLVIADEAHRTAGVKATKLFNLALDEKELPSKNRLFMTATEKLLKPRVKSKYEEKQFEVFSMDDVSKYGPILSELNFGDAIEKKIICDYEILISTVPQKDVFNFLRSNNKLHSNQLSENDIAIRSESAFKQLLLIKAILSGQVTKVISYHSSIAQAKAFVTGSGQGDYGMIDYLKNYAGELKGKKVFIGHVNGSMSAGERKKIFDDFEKSDIGIISNAQCLTEGVDLPEVDCVYFVDSRHSMVDIVQAVGRSLRKSKTNSEKIARVIVPIMINDQVPEEEFLNNYDFSMIHNVVQSMRDQDSRLAAWVDDLNLAASKGERKLSGLNFTGKGRGKVSIESIVHDFNLNFLMDEIFLRVATVNADPESIKYATAKNYGEKDRKSEFRRVFKTIGDYSVSSYFNSLVEPTLKKIGSLKKEIFCNKEIKVNNNNVSHTFRVGLIEEVGKEYKLSKLGSRFINGKENFNSLFKRQMIKYYQVNDKDLLFPYAATLYMMKELKFLNYIDFVFGLYVLQDSRKDTLDQAIVDIKEIRKDFPMIETLNESNRKKVLDVLNERFGTSFNDTDIWAKKTTIYNQFIYFRNHINLFNTIFKDSKTSLVLKRDDFKLIDDLLGQNPYMFDDNVDIVKLEEWYRS